MSPESEDFLVLKKVKPEKIGMLTEFNRRIHVLVIPQMLPRSLLKRRASHVSHCILRVIQIQRNPLTGP